MHAELENFEKKPSVGVSGATTELQTYWDKMDVEKQRGRKW
jgi:hypothetical protein